MTDDLNNLVDVTNKLYAYFLDHPTFELAKNWKSIIEISADEEKDQALIESALDGFITAGMVKKGEKKKRIFYFLCKPLMDCTSTIEVPAKMIRFICQENNVFSQHIQEDLECFSNPLNFNIKDLIYFVNAYEHLCQVIQEMKSPEETNLIGENAESNESEENV